jgi:hypothetical protein
LRGQIFSLGNAELPAQFRRVARSTIPISVWEILFPAGLPSRRSKAGPGSTVPFSSIRKYGKS